MQAETGIDGRRCIPVPMAGNYSGSNPALAASAIGGIPRTGGCRSSRLLRNLLIDDIASFGYA